MHREKEKNGNYFLDIFQYIDSKRNLVSRRTANRFDALLKPLRLWHSSENALDPLALITPSGINAFEQYMTGPFVRQSLRKSISGTTAAENIATLRTICRTAIKEDLMPNLRIFDSGSADDATAVEIKGREDTRLARAKIARLIAFNPVGTRQRRWVDLLLASILLIGTPPRTLLTLKKEALRENSILRLPHFGNMDIALPPALLTILKRNFAGPDSPYLLDYIKHDSDELKIAASLRKANKNVTSLARETGLDFNPLDPRPELTLWLNAAAESIPLSSLYEIINLRTFNTSELSAEASRDLAIIIAGLSEDSGHITPRWHAVRALEMTGRELMNFLRRVADTAMIKRMEFYPPEDINISKRGSKVIRFNNPALNRLLLIHATTADARKAQQLMRTKGIFYTHRATADEHSRTLSQIPNREVENFRRMLSVRDEQRVYNLGMKAEGKKVRITAGIYAGCEGIIVNASDDAHTRYFGVRLLGTVLAWTPNIDATAVELIAD